MTVWGFLFCFASWDIIIEHPFFPWVSFVSLAWVTVPRRRCRHTLGAGNLIDIMERGETVYSKDAQAQHICCITTV